MSGGKSGDPEDSGNITARAISSNDPEEEARASAEIPQKKQGAAGITTAAPYVASQWGRGDDRLLGQCGSPGSRSERSKLF
jgi:hypothetical protein